jgi:hypothetical protein
MSATRRITEMIEQETHDEAYNLGKQIASNARRNSIEAAWSSEGADRAEQIKEATEVTKEERDALPDYVTKDSGERETYDTGMVRDTTSGKPRFDLIDPADQPYNETMTYRHAQLMSRGAEKYGSRNWEKASTQEELDRFRQSAYRHFLAWYHGETDEDHGAAVLFNIRGAEYVKGKI